MLQPDEAPPEVPPAPSGPPPAAAPGLSGRITGRRPVTGTTRRRAPEPAAARPAWFQRLSDGLSRSSRELSSNIAGVFTKRKLDEETLQDLEDVLIRADLGMETAIRVTDALSSGRYGRDVSEAEVRAIMAAEVEKVLAGGEAAGARSLAQAACHPGGRRQRHRQDHDHRQARGQARRGGLKVMLAAGDTFRAAAIEQLKIWGERTGAPVVASSSAPMPRASPTRPSSRRRRAAPTC